MSRGGQESGGRTEYAERNLRIVYIYRRKRLYSRLKKNSHVYMKWIFDVKYGKIFSNRFFALIHAQMEK